MLLLAEQSVGLLRTAGIPAQVLYCLRINRALADQSGLDSVARAANLDGAFQARLRGPRPTGVVVVDDVVTTGATLVAAAAALGASGVPVRAATIAATHRRVRPGRRER